jgi:hypothetical protein
VMRTLKEACLWLQEWTVPLPSSGLCKSEMPTNYNSC